MEEIINEADKANGINARLMSFIERIERLEEEKSNLSGDIREVYKTAKFNLYDVRAIKKIIKLRKLDAHEIVEEEFIYEKYKRLAGL